MASIDDISHAKAGLPGANRTAPETTAEVAAMVPLHDLLAALQPFINPCALYFQWVGATVILAMALGRLGR